MSPVELGVWNDFYIHDGFVRGDTLWAACLEDGVFVVDVSNPSTPAVLANWDTPSEFAHNVWPSDDNAQCYTTDEVTSGQSPRICERGSNGPVLAGLRRWASVCLHGAEHIKQTNAWMLALHVLFSLVVAEQ